VQLLRLAPAGRFATAAGALVALLVAGPSAAAGEVPRVSGSRPPAAEAAPPVEELVARALANSPSIAARRARIAAAQAAAKAADVLPDPMLEFEVKDAGFPKWTLGDDPMSMIGATLRQPLVSKGRKASRVAAATAEIEVRQSEATAAAAELAAAVQTGYSRLYAVDRERAILRDSEELARLLAETAMARYASGASDQAVVLRAQLERTRLAEREADLEADRWMLVVAINRLLNQPPDTPLGEVRNLPEPQSRDTAPAGLAETAATQAPTVSARKADVTAATRRVEMLKEELHPNWTVGGSFFWQGGVDRVVSVTVGVDFPWRKERNQQPLIAASERELEAARFELADTAAAMQAEAARLAIDIKRAEDQIVRYRSGLLPQSSAALDAARASYLGGRGDFASVLDEFRRWTEIRVELARREASRFAASAQLDTLVNKEPRS
jgi:outer membrane protein, heavy metal efflux system